MSDPFINIQFPNVHHLIPPCYTTIYSPVFLPSFLSLSPMTFILPSPHSPQWWVRPSSSGAWGWPSLPWPVPTAPRHSATYSNHHRAWTFPGPGVEGCARAGCWWVTEKFLDLMIRAVSTYFVWLIFLGSLILSKDKTDFISLLYYPGRIRSTPESEDDNNDTSVLSLGLFPGEYLEYPGEDRTLFRFEAAWDSSLHNSVMLNRVTPPGEHVYMTISAYLEVCVFIYLVYLTVIFSCLLLFFYTCLHSVINSYLFINHPLPFVSSSPFLFTFSSLNSHSWRTMHSRPSSPRTFAWWCMEGTLAPSLAPSGTSSVARTRTQRLTGSVESMKRCWSVRLKQVAQVCGSVPNTQM